MIKNFIFLSAIMLSLPAMSMITDKDDGDGSKNLPLTSPPSDYSLSNNTQQSSEFIKIGSKIPSSSCNSIPINSSENSNDNMGKLRIIRSIATNHLIEKCYFLKNELFNENGNIPEYGVNLTSEKIIQKIINFKSDSTIMRLIEESVFNFVLLNQAPNLLELQILGESYEGKVDFWGKLPEEYWNKKMQKLENYYFDNNIPECLENHYIKKTVQQKLQLPDFEFKLTTEQQQQLDEFFLNHRKMLWKSQHPNLSLEESLIMEFKVKDLEELKKQLIELETWWKKEYKSKE